MSKRTRTMAARRPGFGMTHTAAEERASQWIRDALDPAKAPSKPKTWAQMTEFERAEMRRLYEGKR